MTEMSRRFIQLAKEKYPLSVHYKGIMTEEIINELETECDVKTSSVYMDGTANYIIRWKGGAE